MSTRVKMNQLVRWPDGMVATPRDMIDRGLAEIRVVQKFLASGMGQVRKATALSFREASADTITAHWRAWREAVDTLKDIASFCESQAGHFRLSEGRQAWAKCEAKARDLLKRQNVS